MPRTRTFSLEDVAAAGLQVVEGSGWAALSVRSVAERLGVSPMAIYREVPDARRLRQAIADRAAADLRPGDAGADGPDLVAALHAWGASAYEHLTRRPGLAGYVIGEWTELPAWLDIVETLLARAEREGYEPHDAIVAVNAVFAYVLVRAQLHDRARDAPRRSLEPVRRFKGRYPMITRSRAEFAVARTDVHFAAGLDAILAGLSERAPG